MKFHISCLSNVKKVQSPTCFKSSLMISRQLLDASANVYPVKINDSIKYNVSDEQEFLSSLVGTVIWVEKNLMISLMISTVECVLKGVPMHSGVWFQIYVCITLHLPWYHMFFLFQNKYICINICHNKELYDTIGDLNDLRYADNTIAINQSIIKP